jgi:hypothetical protein
MATYSKDFIVKNGLQIGGHIIPDDDETYDLGSSTKKFRDLYLSAGTIYLGDLVLKDNGDGTMATYESDGTTPASVTASAADITYDNTTSGMTATNAKAALDELMAAVEAIDTATELVYDNSTSGLAATTVKGAIDEIVAEEDANVKALLTNLDGSIIPSADITYDLGSPTKQWRDLYVGPGSLYLNGTKILEDDSGTLKFHADPAQSLSIQTSTTGSTSIAGGAAVNITTSAAAADIALTPTGDIELNADVVIGAGQALTTSNGSALTVNSNLDLGSNTVTAATFYGNLTGNISASSGTTTMNNLVVDGNLTVGGTTTTVNTETINLADNIITLNSNATGTPTENAGIEIERGDSTNVALRWNETNDEWEATLDGLNYKTIVLEGDDTTGNAATATALETARDLSLTGDATATLSGFDGSANVSAAITLANSGVTAASYGSASQVPVITVDAKGRITSASTTSVAGVSSTAYNASTGVLTINTSDGSAFTQDLGVGTGDSPTFVNVTADLTGNASTATALATARTIGLSGDVSGSGSFDGTGNLTIAATIADDSHNHTIANVDGLQTALDAAFVSASASNDTITFTTAGGTTSSVTIDDAVLSTENVQDVVGGMVSSNTESGIAVTYDDTNGKLNFNVNDPTITLTGDVSGSATMTNLGNVSITATIADDSHNHVIANVDGLQTALDASFVSASASNDTITFTTAGGTTSSVSISDAVLSTEQVQDIIGGMVSGNSETDISVTYNDSTGKLNFSVTGGGISASTENTFTALQTFSAGIKNGNPFNYVATTVDSNTTLSAVSGYEIQASSSIVEVASGITLTIASGATVTI